ncbi:hypothetical protein BZL29_4190 [Mycobacterium kansasii]|uniref:Amidohydrolase family domain protein n=1 Tax=Mycobacterium kansasii TaxID=1768 RepID=A0A1V3X6Y6_MYCKA|nr:hypothetical protein BZL29_4190 [Mycobacterium kansasii]
MSSGMLSYPLFDADNHLYETEESLTKYLPQQYRNVIQYVQVKGRTKIAIRGQISDYIPNPTFEVVARPGRWRSTSGWVTRRARAAGRSSASRCVRSRRFANPARGWS